MGVIEVLIKRAKLLNKKIVLPEAYDLRVLQATKQILDEQIGSVVLVGNKAKIRELALPFNFDIDNYKNLEIIDVDKFERINEYALCLYELRKHKGLTQEQALSLCKNPMYFATMMVKMNEADGVVAGATWPSSDTLRPGLQIIKAKKDVDVVSSFFLMSLPESKYEKEYIFTDCGIIPNPTENELATIAIEGAKTYEMLVGKQPYVAMLSFSTHGSAKSDGVDKVKNACEIAKKMAQDLKIDGELQLDAAIDEGVAKTKAPLSTVAGKANVLVFPNLESGNIGYKLVERFAGAQAIGPITQGMRKPINDLSRGCKSKDIVVAFAITAIQANN